MGVGVHGPGGGAPHPGEHWGFTGSQVRLNAPYINPPRVDNTFHPHFITPHLHKYTHTRPTDVTPNPVTSKATSMYLREMHGRCREDAGIETLVTVTTLQ